MKSAHQALESLIAGNSRFVAGEQDHSQSGEARRFKQMPQQEPFAIIIGCSDSRVPAEIVFDQGLGDLFVIRVAGNIIAPSQIGSVEFAADLFGSPLVVVLGHTGCGAIEATLQQMRQASEQRSPNLRSIVERIRPTLQPLLESDSDSDPEKLARRAVRANIRASVNQLRHGSQILENLIASGRLLVVGAEYSIETGEVDFFDRPD